eukprot:3041368-Rhodomonas_salina.1
MKSRGVWCEMSGRVGKTVGVAGSGRSVVGRSVAARERRGRFFPGTLLPILKSGLCTGGIPAYLSPYVGGEKGLDGDHGQGRVLIIISVAYPTSYH